MTPESLAGMFIAATLTVLALVIVWKHAYWKAKQDYELTLHSQERYWRDKYADLERTLNEENSNE